MATTNCRMTRSRQARVSVAWAGEDNKGRHDVAPIRMAPGYYRGFEMVAQDYAIFTHLAEV